MQTKLGVIFRRYGMPLAIYCDNGNPWGAGVPNQWTRLRVWLLKLGIELIHSRPYHPQGRGKKERFHRSLRAEVTAQILNQVWEAAWFGTSKEDFPINVQIIGRWQAESTILHVASVLESVKSYEWYVASALGPISRQTWPCRVGPCSFPHRRAIPPLSSKGRTPVRQAMLARGGHWLAV